MKNKLKYLIISILVLIISLFVIRENLIVNIWFSIIEKNYFIPNESSYFEFKPTKMNDGSGDWWLYGEDNKYYYGLNQENIEPKYFLLRKGKESLLFKRYDYKTWFKKN